ncbi:hypothetical protein NC651_038127 [Populus alba x Populus x berolinensis]|nr:hypothetical protein NC651_038127 [Populus alba x Populus x berolinensis]
MGGGSPFFTTVPSGRVGSAHDSVYSSNDEFKQNAGMRFYGGALYHHAMAEFCFVAGGINCPQITGEEIGNACGVEDIHDGTNYSRCMEDSGSTTRNVTPQKVLHWSAANEKHGNQPSADVKYGNQP